MIVWLLVLVHLSIFMHGTMDSFFAGITRQLDWMIKFEASPQDAVEKFCKARNKDSEAQTKIYTSSCRVRAEWKTGGDFVSPCLTGFTSHDFPKRFYKFSLECQVFLPSSSKPLVVWNGFSVEAYL